MEHSARGRTLIDYLIVACILLAPHTFFMNFSTTLFPSLKFQQALLFGVPGFLVMVKWAQKGVEINRAIFVKSFTYLGFILFGTLMALIYSNDRLYELWLYSKMLYWIYVAVLYLALSREPAVYHVNLIRLFFLHVALLGVLFYVSYAFLGITRPLFYAFAWGDNTYPISFITLSLDFSKNFLGSPRYTFLFQEPRIIGTRMPVGLFLQIGFMCYHYSKWSSKQRLVSWLALFTLIFSMFIIHSLWGYIVLALCAVFLMWNFIVRGHPKLIKAFAGVILVAYVIFLSVVTFGDRAGSNQSAIKQGLTQEFGILDYLERDMGKKPDATMEHVETNLNTLTNLIYFPLGSGLMLMDDDYYFKEYGVHVAGSSSILGNFIIQAGLVGIIFFLYFFSRPLLALQVLQKRPNRILQYYELMIVFTLIASLLADFLQLSASFFFNLLLTESIVIDYRKKREWNRVEA